MNKPLRNALESMFAGIAMDCKTAEEDQRHAILYDLLWKLVRKDYHGVADCAMDLRELHL